MDNFGNYPREKFDPFSVMLFKGLQVVAFLFFIALLAMNPEAKEGKIETKAEFIITMTWPDEHPDDIDLYTEDPLGNIVWYHVRESGFLTLDRDDRGSANNSITVDGRKVSSQFRQETVSVRGIVAGEYTVNVHYFLATRGGPVPASQIAAGRHRRHTRSIPADARSRRATVCARSTVELPTPRSAYTRTFRATGSDVVVRGAICTPSRTRSMPTIAASGARLEAGPQAPKRRVEVEGGNGREQLSSAGEERRQPIRLRSEVSCPRGTLPG